MDNKFHIWKSKFDSKWFILSPKYQVFREESFKDAIQRMNICILEYESA